MNDLEKKHLGLLIKHYRKHGQKDLNPIKQSAFVLDYRNNLPICSVKTLYKIESGIPIKEDSIYELLLNNLGMKYYDFGKNEEDLNRIIDDLYIAVSENNLSDYVKVKKEINKYHKYHDFIIYKEFIDAVSFIVDYNLQNNIPGDLNYYLDTVVIFNRKLRFLVSLCVHEINLVTTLSDEINTKSANLLESNNNNDFLYDYFKGRVLYYSGKYTEAYLVLNDCYNMTSSIANKLSITNIQLQIDNKLDPNYVSTKRVEQIHKLLAQKEDLTANLLAETYMNLGILYCDAKQYQQSIYYFDKVEKISPSSFILFAPYYYYAHEKLSLPVTLRPIDNTGAQEHYQEIAYYYTLKYNATETSELIYYINKVILNKLRLGIFGYGVIRIFIDEILTLSNNDNKYKFAVSALFELLHLDYK